jgi:hypothetical protein
MPSSEKKEKKVPKKAFMTTFGLKMARLVIKQGSG